MKLINVYDSELSDLEVHADHRGIIADVFYSANINHVAIVKSDPYTLRGNHYHKLSTQHILVTKGLLEYWFKQLDSSEPAKMVVVRPGELVSTPPYEIHALKFGHEHTEFIAFSEGPRGGKDYESDTVRVESIIPNKWGL